MAVVRAGVALRQPADLRRAARSEGACPTTPRATSPSGFLPQSHQGTILDAGAPRPIPDLFPPSSAGFLTPESERDGLAGPRAIEPPPRGGQRGRHAARVADRRLRAGGPDAAECARGPRPGRRDAGDACSVRTRRTRHGRLRPPLPAGPPAARARRAVRAGLERRGRRDEQLGQPHRHPQPVAADGPERRPADRGACCAT